MIFDPYKTYQAGRASAEMKAAQMGLENASRDVGYLADYDSSNPVYGKISEALKAIRAARSDSDALWDLARPKR